MDRSRFADKSIRVDCNHLWDRLEGLIDLGEGNVLIEFDGKSVEKRGICELSLDLVIEIQVDGTFVKLVM